jgi:hypothetical protein
MGGASTLRNTVEAAGGRLEVSVWELRDSFGVACLTTAGRERIVRELGAKGLRLEPSLARLRLDERVTIVGPRPRLRLVPAPAGLEPVRIAAPVPWESGPPEMWRPRRSFWSNRRRAVMAGVGVGLLVILLAAVFGWNVGKEEPETGSVQAPAATGGPPATATPPPAVSPRGHPKVVASLQEVDEAIAQDDPGSARRLMSSIDPDVLSADADLALQARVLRNRIRFTESYLGAATLAAAGRYEEARETMLALVPFRDAGVRARLYGVEIAKGLVAQARTEAPVRPDRALALLDQAEGIAPSLSQITEVRTEAGG